MSQKPNEFEQAAQAERQSAGLAGELWSFLKENKKWWLIPILLVLVAFGILVLLAGTGAAPWIYTIF